MHKKDNRPGEQKKNSLEMPESDAGSEKSGITENLHLNPLKQKGFVAGSTSDFIVSGVFIFQGEKMIHVNDAALSICGYSREEALSMSFLDFIHPEMREAIKELGLKLQNKEVSELARYEVKFITKQGKTKWVNYGSGIIEYEGKPAIIGSAIDITGHKQIGDALRESEQRFRIIFDNASDGILIADIRTKKFLTGNKKICQMLGYSLEELEKMGVQDIHLKEDLPIIIKRFEQHPWNETELAKDIRVKSKNGNIFYVNISASQIILDKKPYLIGMFRDITARKQVEEELKKFKFISDHASEAYFLVDDQARFLYVNKAACEELGYKEHELLNLGVPEVDMLYDKVKYQKLFDLIHKEKVPPFETTNRRKDGSTFLSEISSTGLKIDGKPYMFAVLRNITARKQAEDELISSKESLEKLFETSADGIISADSMGYIKKANSSMTDITGYSVEELVGKHILELVHNPGQNSGRMDTVRSLVRKHGVVYQYESLWRRKDGSTYPVENQFAYLLENDGNESGGIIVVRDITNRKKREESVRQIQEELEKRVIERTSELAKMNKQLLEREKQLELKTSNLKELNTALRVLLNRRGEDLEGIEEKILLNVNELVKPYIEKIKKLNLDSRQLGFLNILESNLNDILSPFLQKLSAKFLNLTPAEIKVANLIKRGKRTKEIAELMSLSKRTIDFYRDNIRKKLGLNKGKTNLRTYLQTVK